MVEDSLSEFHDPSQGGTGRTHSVGAPTAAELMDCVEGSPAAVAAHDRAAWLGLFAVDAMVEDPVGSRPRQGLGKISAFWDAFIAPNRIFFGVAHDEVWPTDIGGVVVRDLELTTVVGGAEGDGGPSVTAPMHLRYDVVGQPDGKLRIAALRAHWSQPGLFAQLLGHGVGGVTAGGSMAVRLVSTLGTVDTAGFALGSYRPARSRRTTVVDLLGALGRSEDGVAEALCTRANVLTGDGRALHPDELRRLCAGIRVGKVVVAGRYVTCTVLREHDRGRGIVEYLASAGGRPTVTFFLRPELAAGGRIVSG